ncbi:winged helix-turn-helix domain-containing protein [Sphingomonas parva]|uniref:winged helix-turn-helix domain-containing protein n=1 Tax=Sphingomonas parva TaxID=2555898 RepID=UPI00142F5A45|nr:crosslink repair DNA glycosylase YcaQ family protein [Sphingomonas parva]
MRSTPVPRRSDTLSLAGARRIALAASGFGRSRPGAVRRSDLARTVERLALHQIDSVNVVARAHYLPAFSRLGAYDRALLDRAAWGPKRARTLFEYWGHEASLLPLAFHPLLRWRMAEADRGEIGWRHLRAFALERRAEAEAVLARIRDEGPLAASDFGAGRPRWWEWSDAKRALEWLFWAGHVTTATRRGTFERVYDLPERVLPHALLGLATPDAPEAQRQLIERSARALGVATAADLRDYFRLKPEPTAAAIAVLAEEGVLQPVAVNGWRQIAWLHRDARRPRRIDVQALLAPFDPLVWERARTERLFGFRYRIEIYTPAEKRVHGYYVLPFLLGDRLVGRVDLKADRARSALVARRIGFEADAPAEAAARLDEELALMAAWLGLERVERG